MSGVKRFDMHYEYAGGGGQGCSCDIEESMDGYYVEYSAYMSLLSEYAEFKQNKEVSDMNTRINADGFSVRDVAKYMADGYTLRLTDKGWVMFKLSVVPKT